MDEAKGKVSDKDVALLEKFKGTWMEGHQVYVMFFTKDDLWDNIALLEKNERLEVSAKRIKDRLMFQIGATHPINFKRH
jgi:hypothetical protein